MIVTIDVSKDGNRIVFTEIVDSSSDLHRNICIYDLSKQKIVYRMVSKYDDFDPRFSNNGKSILYSSRELGDDAHGFVKPAHLYMLNLDTGAIKNITRDSRRGDSNARFSPDGTKIVFSGYLPESQLFGTTDIYLYDFGTNKVSRLTHNKLTMVPYPTFFGPDESILINIENGEKQGVCLAILRKSKKYKIEPITRIDDPEYGVLFPYPMPDGKILCTVNNHYNYELSILEKGVFRVLSKSPYCFSSPVFHARTNTVFWASGDVNLFALNLTTNTTRKIAGRELFYGEYASKGGALNFFQGLFKRAVGLFHR
ncbi:MAG: hypothetical protein QM758_07270 [Armatimonas sp.]